MIQKYYNSILEQVLTQIGKKEHNIVLAKYSNDFSLKQLEISKSILQLAEKKKDRALLCILYPLCNLYVSVKTAGSH